MYGNDGLDYERYLRGGRRDNDRVADIRYEDQCERERDETQEEPEAETHDHD